MAAVTYIESARRSAGITQAGAGAIMGMSNVTYGKKEKEPEQFTLGEFFALYRELDPESQEIMWCQLVELSRGKNFAVEV